MHHWSDWTVTYLPGDKGKLLEMMRRAYLRSPRAQPAGEHCCVVDNPPESRQVLYLETGDFVRPGEWFAVPLADPDWLVYPLPETGVAAQSAV